jgi:hypothetical protein
MILRFGSAGAAGGGLFGGSAEEEVIVAGVDIRHLHNEHG